MKASRVLLLGIFLSLFLLFNVDFAAAPSCPGYGGCEPAGSACWGVLGCEGCCTEDPEPESSNFCDDDPCTGSCQTCDSNLEKCVSTKESCGSNEYEDGCGCENKCDTKDCGSDSCSDGTVYFRSCSRSTGNCVVNTDTASCSSAYDSSGTCYYDCDQECSGLSSIAVYQTDSPKPGCGDISGSSAGSSCKYDGRTSCSDSANGWESCSYDTGVWNIGGSGDLASANYNGCCEIEDSDYAIDFKNDGDSPLTSNGLFSGSTACCKSGDVCISGDKCISSGYVEASLRDSKGLFCNLGTWQGADDSALACSYITDNAEPYNKNWLLDGEGVGDCCSDDKDEWTTDEKGTNVDFVNSDTRGCCNEKTDCFAKGSTGSGSNGGCYDSKSGDEGYKVFSLAKDMYALCDNNDANGFWKDCDENFDKCFNQFNEFVFDEKFNSFEQVSSGEKVGIGRGVNGHGEYTTFGDGPSTCGDDLDEYPRYQRMNDDDNGESIISDHPSKVKVITNENSRVCCNGMSDCVYQGVCYQGSNVDGDINAYHDLYENALTIGQPDFYCKDSEWYNVDHSESICSPQAKYEWNIGGIAVSDDKFLTPNGKPSKCGIDSTENPSQFCCCGDDLDEFVLYQKGSISSGSKPVWADDQNDNACCDSETDCVSNNRCYNSYSDIAAFGVDVETTIARDLNFGGDDNIGYCSNGFWTICDSGNFDSCLEENVIAGMDLGGSYTKGVSDACGDDAGEYKTECRDETTRSEEVCPAPASAYAGTVCCDEPTDCIGPDGDCIDSKLFPKGDVALGSHCVDGTWQDLDPLLGGEPTSEKGNGICDHDEVGTIGSPNFSCDCVNFKLNDKICSLCEYPELTTEIPAGRPEGSKSSPDDCNFDPTTGCGNEGKNLLDFRNEQCDGPTLGGATCNNLDIDFDGNLDSIDIMTSSGSVSCIADVCMYNLDACQPKYCGDGTCNYPIENINTCDKDCPQKGDGICSFDEFSDDDINTNVGDCTPESRSDDYCGFFEWCDPDVNSICDNGETNLNNPGECKFISGDGICSANELINFIEATVASKVNLKSPVNFDCAPILYDGSCSSPGELSDDFKEGTYADINKVFHVFRYGYVSAARIPIAQGGSSDSSDYFGDCKPYQYCGDGICASPTETSANCVMDCPLSTCGNGVCDSNLPGLNKENFENCPRDCPPVNDDARDIAGVGFCGDGYCQISESPYTCSEDCAKSKRAGSIVDVTPNNDICEWGELPGNC